MGKQKTYSWEFKVQMVHLLAKGTHNMSQISREYHVTRSLLYAWIGCIRNEEKPPLFPIGQPICHVARRATTQCRGASHASRTALRTTGARTRCTARGGGSVKKSLASASIQHRHALIERLRELMPSVSVRKLCVLLAHQPAMVLPASSSLCSEEWRPIAGARHCKN